MPLLNKQPFEPNLVPENLGPDDEVFYFWRTNEIFTNHDDYFSRYLQVQSLVWTCSRTGRSGLTYEEALESEQSTDEPQQSVRKKRKRKKNADESTEENDQTDTGTPKKSRKKAKTATTSPNQDEDHQSEDEGNLTSTGYIDHANQSADGQSAKKKKKKYPYDPKKYAMPVPDGFDPSLLTPTGKIDGRKLKSKKNQQLADELLAASGYVPKTPSAQPGKRGKRPKDEDRRREDDAKKKDDESKKKSQMQAELAKEREMETKRKKEALALAKQIERQKKEDERKKAAAFLQNWDKKCEDLERDDLKRLPQPTAVNCDIPERLFGDSIYIMEAIYNFHDLYNLNTIYPEGLTFDTLEEILLDKHEDGPLGTLLQFLLRVIFDTQPTQDGYGLDDDSMRTLKQSDSSSAAQSKHNNKSGAKTVNGNDSDATDCDSGHEEEEHDDHEDHHHQQDEEEDENDDENGEKYVNMNDRIGSAIKAAREVKKTFSKPLPEMDINSTNVTEILRLHLLQSGSFPKGRTIYNGWYSSREDPGLWLCMQEPDLIKKLSEVTVYDLEIDERIKILHTLINQLLTFIKSRLFMEAASEQLTELRKQYRKDAADFARWDRENCVKRMQPPKRKNDQTPATTSGGHDSNNKQGTDQMQHHEFHCLAGDEEGDTHSLDDKDNQDNQSNLKSCLKTNGASDNQEDDNDQTASSKAKKISFERNPNGATMNGHSNCNGDTGQATGEQLAEGQSFEELERAYQQNTVDYEDYQRERAIRLEQLNETLLGLRTQLRTHQSIYAIHPIGRDRAYRRYWLFQSMPGLFVEQDDEYVGQCLPQPTPLESRYKKLFGKENPLIHPNEADLIRVKTCDASSSTAEGSHDYHYEIRDGKTNVIKKEPQVEDENTNLTNGETGDNIKPNARNDSENIADVKVQGITMNNEGNDNHHGSGSNAEQDGIITDEMNLCTGDEATCYIHGPKRPREKWWFYHQPESIDRLIETLNKRGYRECELHDVLSAESTLIKPRVAECPAYKLNKTILEQSGIRRSRRLRTKGGKRSRRNFSD